jgi:hypothetical protein
MVGLFVWYLYTAHTKVSRTFESQDTYRSGTGFSAARGLQLLAG